MLMKPASFHTLCFAAVVLLVNACTGAAPVVGATDTSPPLDDRPKVDTSDDLPLDVSSMDANDGMVSQDTLDVIDVIDVIDVTDVTIPTDTTDVVSTDTSTRCTGAADCRTDPMLSVCDVTTGQCVQCVATSDTCPAAQHCNATTQRCEAGCRNDDGCTAVMGSDAGMAARTRCDVVAHRCVDCLTNDHCPVGMLCAANVCSPGCSATRGCPSGQACCGSACVETATSLAHCGRCDGRCDVANGLPICLAGSCSVAGCTAPFGDCDRSATNGCETDTRTAVAHCGACGSACRVPANATATCEGGRCGYVCATGFSDCDLDPANGCEVDLQTDATRCGTCSIACNPPNATPSCVAGRCAVATCDTGFGDCDSNATNGCETNVRTTVTHCGRCGNACPERPNAFPGCVAGTCVISCLAGFADCDGDATNGCEVNTRTSASHCGACGRSCAASGGTGICEGSVCRVTGCDAGRGNCDGVAANGCEVDLTATLTHCGACANVCPARLNAISTCAGGACGFTCITGFADCDRVAANGCEASLTDITSCGSCSVACADATPVCTSGSCVSGCSVTQQRCDGVCVDPQSNPVHCGGCGVVCPNVPASSRVCVSGRCSFVCDSGRGDCDRVATNGCEATLASDNANCGACGRSCGFGAACRSGTCVSVLPPGLLAWYRFEEGSGNLVGDSSGRGYNGTHNATYAPGRLGMSLEFNGTNRAVVPYTEGFTWGNDNADFTVEYWLYITVPPTGAWRCVTHKGIDDCGTGNRTTAQWLGPGSMQIYPAISTVSSCNEYFVGPTLPLNTWTHFADVKQGTTHYVYVNGTLAQSGPVNPSVGNLGPYYIGWDPWYTGINGRLDELRVYTRALSASEVNEDLRATSGP
jgi:hypothetical protein